MLVLRRLQGMFEEMQRAKRHQALGHRHIDDVMDVPKNQMQVRSQLDVVMSLI
jgi:hypothetical protein